MNPLIIMGLSGTFFLVILVLLLLIMAHEQPEKRRTNARAKQDIYKIKQQISE